MAQCQCITSRKVQCKNKAKPSSKYCGVHKNCKTTSMTKKPVTGALEKLTVPQLKEKLRAKKLPVGGKKADLIARLRGAAVAATKNVSKLSLHDLRMELWKRGLNVEGTRAVISKRLSENYDARQIHSLKDLKNKHILSVPTILLERDGSYQTIFGYLGTPAHGPLDATTPKYLPKLADGEILRVHIHGEKTSVARLLPNKWFAPSEKIIVMYHSVPGGPLQKQIYVNQDGKWKAVKK